MIPAGVGAEVFTVNSAGDEPDGDLGDGICDTGNVTDGFTGMCTLRAALQNTASFDEIRFDEAIRRIAPLTVLPNLLGSIDGTVGVSRVELSGVNLISGDGLRVRGGPALVSSLVINRFPGNGIDVQTSASALIENCYIGTDTTGTSSEGFGNGENGIELRLTSDVTIGGGMGGRSNVISGNADAGIRVIGRNFFVGPARRIRIIGNFIGTNVIGTEPLPNGSHGVILGESDLAVIESVIEDNVISGNGGDGVLVQGRRPDVPAGDYGPNSIRNNRIGTDATGSVELGNHGSGVHLRRADDTIVGSASPEDRNIISGNRGHGILLDGFFTDTNTVQGNHVGVDSSGTAPLGNQKSGIFMASGTIGLIGSREVAPGTSAPPANVIAHNGDDGVTLIESNEGRPTRQTIVGNSIFSNGDLGIDLADDGPTFNDLDDPDRGPNNQTNFPIITSVEVAGGTTRIQGILDDRQNAPHTLDFYANTLCDAGGFGEGQVFIGSSPPLALPPFGQSAPFDVTLAGEHQNITVTSTDIAGSTSEFSPCGLVFESIVNSVSDAGDNNRGDGACWTGVMIDVGGIMVPECTLRAAIEEANDRPGFDFISFAIPGSAVHTIAPATPFEPLSEQVSIDGLTQVLFDPFSVIQISGTRQPGVHGLTLEAGGSSLRSLVINGFAGHGAVIRGGSGGTVQGCFIGTDPTGNAAAGTGNGQSGVLIENSSGNQIVSNILSSNDLGLTITGTSQSNRVVDNLIGVGFDGTTDLGNASAGVRIEDGADANRIGGPNADDTNVISGNGGPGLVINGSSNRVEGNLIGVSRPGIADVRNDGDGVLVGGADNLVGGDVTQPGNPPGNLISGNGAAGVTIGGSGATGNLLRGNLVGLGRTGETLMNHTDGVVIQGNASMNRVGDTTSARRNVISGNGENGVRIRGDATMNVVAGNFIGTDPAGEKTRANGHNGVFIDGAPLGGSASNTIGGFADRVGQPPGNVISGNGQEDPGSDEERFNGILIRASSQNQILGNIVGAAADGNAGIGFAGDLTGPSAQRTGVRLLGAGDNVIGRAGGSANLISGNLHTGVALVAGLEGLSGGSNGNMIQGNLIGPRADGEGPVRTPTVFGNCVQSVGVRIAESSDNLIGELSGGQGNTVAFNDANGVIVRLLGTASGNRIQGNSIFDNGGVADPQGLGIDLGGDGVTFNDAGDADSGPNGLQNFPELTAPAAGATSVDGTLNSQPDRAHTVEFFLSPNCNPPLGNNLGAGEGKTPLGSLDVMTDATGNAAFTFALPFAPQGIQFLTATATDPMDGTSEFSQCVPLVSDNLPDAQQIIDRILGGGSGQGPQGPIEPPDLDVNANGVVDVADLVRLLAFGPDG
jgi:CSLREA domain-containing protein